MEIAAIVVMLLLARSIYKWWGYFLASIILMDYIQENGLPEPNEQILHRLITKRMSNAEIIRKFFNS